jgi:hypothetical protein
MEPVPRFVPAIAASIPDMILPIADQRQRHRHGNPGTPGSAPRSTCLCPRKCPFQPRRPEVLQQQTRMSHSSMRHVEGPILLGRLSVLGEIRQQRRSS